MELYLGLGFICFAIIYKLSTKKKRPTYQQEQEADRYFNKRCEVSSWNDLEGRIHTKGFALVRIKDNEYSFIKQSKLADTSILY